MSHYTKVPVRPEDDDLDYLVAQIRAFAQGRPIKLLTRQRLPQADGSVVKDSTLISNIVDGTLQIHITVEKDTGVGASNIRVLPDFPPEQSHEQP